MAETSPMHAEPGAGLTRSLLSFRFLLLAASLGTLVGALAMFWEAGSKLVKAARVLLASEMQAKPVTSLVMGATDLLLFGIVLLIFSAAITFGFALNLTEEARQRLPRWMRVGSVGELKQILIEVVLVYLVVDFATDIADRDGPLPWQALVLPLSIALIAAALSLIRAGEGHGSEGRS